jgi:antirestriction protein
MKDLAVQFVEEGLLGDFPERIVNYLDFDAIARDISFDYVEATIAGTRLIYRIM